MDMCHNFWYFGDKPSFRIPFSKEAPLSTDESLVEINSTSCSSNSIPSEVPIQSNPVDETETNDLHLREEGQALSVEERNDLIFLLNESKDDFRLGREPISFVKHFLANSRPLLKLDVATRTDRKDYDCQVIYSQFGLAIHQNDHQARRRFVEWAQNEIAVVPNFHKRILFSDEAHFWLNGYVNKQNCRIWNEANPQVYVETPLHPEKLTVWCALWAGGILLQKR
ncbi:uncharacterized protein TNCV_4096801 [Trichonephila clavipes]|nr:uncharacterized protein TNCV_4096801 [Trichonephila clavipes]